MKFNITLFKEEYDENGSLKDKHKKTVEIQADTCCDAIIIATKSNRGWTVSEWKCLDKSRVHEFIPETLHEKEAWTKVLKQRKDEKAKQDNESSIPADDQEVE